MVFFCSALLGFVFWALFGLVLTPVFDRHTVTYCFSNGNGSALERTVRAYGWLREGKRNGGELVIVDCGLSAEGKRLVDGLRQDRMWLSCCPLEKLPDHAKLLQQCLENNEEL